MYSARAHDVSRVVHLPLLLAVVVPKHVGKQAVQRQVADTAALRFDLEAAHEA